MQPNPISHGTAGCSNAKIPVPVATYSGTTRAARILLRGKQTFPLEKIKAQQLDFSNLHHLFGWHRLESLHVGLWSPTWRIGYSGVEFLRSHALLGLVLPLPTLPMSCYTHPLPLPTPKILNANWHWLSAGGICSLGATDMTYSMFATSNADTGPQHQR